MPVPPVCLCAVNGVVDNDSVFLFGFVQHFGPVLPELPVNLAVGHLSTEPGL